MTEQQIQKQIQDYLSSIGAYAIKVQSANRAGVPDILACHNSHFYAFEIKRPGESPSPLQLHHQSLIHQSGGKAFIVDNLPIVQSIFSKEIII